MLIIVLCRTPIESIMTHSLMLIMFAAIFSQLFNEGRALEQQGNIAAAQRLYGKVTRLAPRVSDSDSIIYFQCLYLYCTYIFLIRFHSVTLHYITPQFIYGWASLGNTQVALGALPPAEASYSRAIDLCVESNQEEEQFGVARCSDLYLLHLNRGSLRMNNGRAKEALKDLEMADALRGKPDAIILQNRARARELNGLYAASDRDYTMAVSMTSNEVAPFWLRSALVKFQLGDTLGAFDLLRRVENKFPEAPEVRAALATFLVAKGDQETAQRKFLEIPDRARLKYVDENYLRNTIAWPPKMMEFLSKLTEAVGDTQKGLEASSVAL